MSRIIRKNQKAKTDEKKEALIDELIEVIGKLGFEVRIEKGTFRGGFCLLREQKLFLLNKNLDQDKVISILARSISGLGTEGIYLKPNLRELVEREGEGN